MDISNADHAQIAAMQRTIAAALLPHRHNTQAALAVIALVRCARTLIRLYPNETREALTDASRRYLAGEAADEGGVIIPHGWTM